MLKQRFLSFGIDPLHTELERRKIRLLNFMSLGISVASVPFIATFAYLGQWLICVVGCATCLSYMVPIVLCKYHKVQIAKYTSIGLMIGACLVFSLLLGKKIPLGGWCISTLVLPFLYFEKKNYGSILGSVFLCLLLFLFISLKPASWSLNIHLDLSQSAVSIINLMVDLTTFLILSLGMYVLLEDVELKEQEMRNLHSQKQDLINMMCHDISNPLSFCSLAVFKMKKANKSGKTQLDIPELLQEMDLGLKTVKEIIQSVRLMQATELGKLHVELKPVELQACIANSCLLLESKASEKSIQLVQSYKINEGVGVLADAHSLANNVISNFISNAIKFSKKNGKVHISAEEVQHGILLKIKDDGIGMPLEVQKNIFDASKKTNRAGTDGEKGTGFGMPLAKSLLDAYGAQIEIDSKSLEEHPLESGTCFSILFQKSTLPEALKKSA